MIFRFATNQIALPSPPWVWVPLISSPGSPRPPLPSSPLPSRRDVTLDASNAGCPVTRSLFSRRTSQRRPGYGVSRPSLPPSPRSVRLILTGRARAGPPTSASPARRLLASPAAAGSTMGSFKGHALPGTLFLAVGLWRVWSSVARFAADPPAFRVRAWNPVGPPGSAAPRHLELYVVAAGAFADMCVEVLYSTHLRVFAGGGVNPAHLNDLEHGGMLLMFFLFGALALLSQKTRYLPLSDGALSLVAATAFTAEFLLFYYHSTTHMGLEGYYHYLLVVLVGLCIATTVLGALLPASFPTDLGAGVLIALQGLWFYQTALTLYGPMLPAGCARDADGHVECRNRGAQERAEQLANFQLFGLVFLAFVYVLVCYAVAAARYGHPDLAATHAAHVAEMESQGGAGAGEGLPLVGRAI